MNGKKYQKYDQQLVETKTNYENSLFLFQLSCKDQNITPSNL